MPDLNLENSKYFGNYFQDFKSNCNFEIKYVGT